MAAGAALVLAGCIAVGAVAFTLYERARSGSDAARFAVDVPPDRVSSSGLAGGTGPALAGETADSASIYPGSRMHPKYWAEPLWAGPAPFAAASVPPGFEPVSSRDVALAPLTTGQAVRLRVPAIALDSPVAPLEINDLGDQREYETPVNTVGFIPDTALPGEAANGWYFGHLESFVSNEGSVFRRLPEVADLARHDPVDIYLSTPQAEYLYRVTSTRQVHQDDLALQETPDSRITLVTCWPPRVYDHRIVVQAELIAVKRAASETTS
jgi:LPXTG-site transpeptidase (sortase) family protein